MALLGTRFWTARLSHDCILDQSCRYDSRPIPTLQIIRYVLLESFIFIAFCYIRIACDSQSPVLLTLLVANYQKIMGSSASKPETKVFTPKAPVEYSASFLAHLESSQETDYTRAQYAESYIQERVALELQKLERDAIEKYQASASDALLKDTTNAVLYESSNEKLKIAQSRS